VFPAIDIDIRRGSAKETRGTAYVVYDDIYDAKVACDHLSGFNVANRYLIVLYYRPGSMNKKVWGLEVRT
jgi:pre-mRNA branch site protein p14